MTELLNQVLAFIAAHADMAGPILGGIALFLCLAVVGILLPAPPIFAAVGGLIASGTLPMWPMLGFTIAGGALGYIISYYLGRWLGPGIFHRWPLKNHRRSVARSRVMFRRYASLAVFASRIFGPLRCAIPVVAGVVGMNQHKFHIANLLSAIVWAPALMAPGWVAVKGLAELESLGEAHWLSVTVAGVVLLALVLAAGFKLQRMRLERQRRRAHRPPRRKAPAA
jgi:membrane protein DedA with SNARE-associated domain